MKYFAKITKQSKGYLVEFPDLRGCLTEGRSLVEAKSNASEVLNGWLESNCDRELNIPKTKERKGKNYHAIEVDIRIAFAIDLRRLRKKKGLSQAQVAKKLGVSQQAYSKLETPGVSNPSLSTIKRLSEALDADLVLDLVA